MAYNALSHNVIFEENDKTKGLSSKDKNAMIYRLIQLIEKNDGTLSVEFYIHKNKKRQLRIYIIRKRFASFQKEIFSAKRVEELTQEQRDMSARELFEYLRYDEGSNSPKFLIDKNMMKILH